MELAALLAEAHAAPPGLRIEWRDRIAAHGVPAIEGVRPWLESGTLAAFAVRVIERVGVDGEPALAGKVLRSARSRVPAYVTADVDWALQRLRLVSRPAPKKPATLVLAAPKPQESPRYTAAAQRRAR
jgi:hypothetical protein